MKPHPRIRKTVKWGGAALFTVLLLVALASVWWTAVFRTTQFVSGGVYMGGVDIESPGFHGPPASYITCFALPEPHKIMWHAHWRRREDEWSLFVPFWCLAGPPLIASLFAWDADHKARRVRLQT